MENKSERGIIWLVIALLVIGGGIYLWQDDGVTYQPSTPDDSETVELTEYFQSKDLGFAMMLPEGYSVFEQPMGVVVVKDSVEENGEPDPEFQVQVTEGNLDDFKVGKGIVMLSDEEVMINGMKGRKFVISADSLPEGTECDFYSFEDRGVVYEFSEYQCQDSAIFEAVLNTFTIIWEK